MNTNITFRIVLIALFLFSYQSTIIHLKQHQVSSVDECLICHAAQYSKEQHQQSTLVYFAQNSAIKQEQITTQQLTREAYTLIQTPIYRLSDFDGYKERTTQFLPIGYFATAPPYFS